MRTNSNYLIPFAMAVTLAAGLWMGHILTPNNTTVSMTSGEEKYSKVKDIIQILNEKYVDSLDGDKIFEEAISDMLHKLDPHSNYIPASEFKLASEMIEGKFGGVGVRFSIIRDTICVTNVIEGSPSSVAGVKPGDKIITIENKKVASKKINNERVMKMLKGTENTPVNVEIYRKGKKIKKQIIRGVIPIESIVCATMLSKDIGYIKLDQFSVTSDTEFNRAATKLKAKGMKKLIFDLRNNGGGVLQSATEIVDEFLGQDVPIVKTKGMHAGQVTYKATSEGLLEKMEVVVLINSNSASASEIVAGALQDNDRATIMGRRSFGKGLVQEDILLKDGSNLRLTIARYYTPTGRCIQKPYSENFDEYYEDQLQRYENGELYHIDSSLLKNAKKYKTPKGKIVYDGGGIMPDIFIPMDTMGLSWYFTDLRYTPAFQNYAFDFLSNKRGNWKTLEEFNSKFQVSDKMLRDFTAYADKYYKIPLNTKGFETSKEVIRYNLKAEIARQLWTEQGYYTVVSAYDTEVLKALQFLQK
jgi:carboxyl-terminal processing protease